MKLSITTLLAASSTLLATNVFAGVELAQLDPSQVTIQSLQSSGSGCPFGTVSSTIAPDGKSFVLGFDEYIAEAGPDISRRENRKNCQITAVLGIPNGYAFTLADVNYRGYADLDEHVIAQQISTYFFAGERQEARLSSAFSGPISDNYQISDRIGLQSLVWSSCNATEPVVIKSEVKVDNRNARQNSGLITLDTIDGKLTHSYGLMFKKCGDVSPSGERI